MSQLTCAAALLSACALDTDGTGELEHRFGTRPVNVQASSELPDACMVSLVDALAFYAAHDATLVLELVDPGVPSQIGIPVAGVVAVVPGKLSTNVHGETRLSLTVGGNVFAAEVTLASCEPRAVAHELGHALGLPHSPERGSLMYYALNGGGWTLSDAERAWIAD